ERPGRTRTGRRVPAPSSSRRRCAKPWQAASRQALPSSERRGPAPPRGRVLAPRAGGGPGGGRAPPPPAAGPAPAPAAGRGGGGPLAERHRLGGAGGRGALLRRDAKAAAEARGNGRAGGRKRRPRAA